MTGGGRPCADRAEVGVIGPQAREHCELCGAGRGRRDPPLEASAGLRSCLHLHFSIWLPDNERIHFCHFKAAVCGALLGQT